MHQIDQRRLHDLGTAHINLYRLKEKEAATRIGQPVFRFLKAEYDDKKIDRVTVGHNGEVNGRISVYGRLLAPEAVMQVLRLAPYLKLHGCCHLLSNRETPSYYYLMKVKSLVCLVQKLLWNNILWPISANLL